MIPLERGDGVVRVRPFREDDEQGLCAAARESVVEVGRYLPWCHPGYGPSDAREWIATTRALLESEEGWHLAIVGERDGGLLGGVGLGPLIRTHRTANLGWWVRTGATSRGVATRAARLATEIGFELGLTRLEIVVAVGNTASLRVAAKLGARREGRLRNRIVVGGEALDAEVFSLIPGDLDG